MGKVLVAAAVAAIVIACIAFAFVFYHKPSVSDLTRGVECSIRVTSVFSNNTSIPQGYTCGSTGTEAYVSPPVSWSGGPPGVKSYALIMYDPDAPHGVFYHWIIYDIPPNIHHIPRGLGNSVVTRYGVQGYNSYGFVGYGPPCPPRGSVHHYVILVLALDKKLGVEKPLKPEDFIKMVRKHVIAYGCLVGLYGR